MRQRPSLKDLLSNQDKELAFIFDFDGTLADISEDPASVRISDEVIHRLHWLGEKTKGKTLVLSGRPLNFLTDIFRDARIGLTGEHGADSNYFSIRSAKIPTVVPDSAAYFLRTLAEQHEGSFVEEKPISSVWHYRKAKEEISETLASTYKDRLMKLLQGTGYICGHYSYVLEIKPEVYSKQHYVSRLLKGPFANHEIIAFGDDIPEEEMFLVLEGRGIRFAVGERIQQYDFRFSTPEDLRNWLLQD